MEENIKIAENKMETVSKHNEQHIAQMSKRSHNE